MRSLTLIVFALVALALPAPALGGGAEPAVQITGGTAVQLLPDIDGASRLRLRNDLSLHARLGSRWSFFGAGNLRYSERLFEDALQTAQVYAGRSLDEADLHRLALKYGTPELTITAGRFVRTALTGRHKVDGASVEVGRRSLPVGFEAWVGRVGHAEPLTPLSAFGGGFEARVTPLSKSGYWSGVAIRAGYSLYKNTRGLKHVAHAAGSFRDGRGGTVDGGATVGVLDGEDEPDVGVRGWFRARVRPTSRLLLGGGVRWEGLTPVGVPDSAVGMMEAHVPRGYLVADLLMNLHFDKISLRVEGGPTVAPRVNDTVRMGGKGRVSAAVTAGDGTIAPFLIGASVGGSSYYGGGVAARGTVKILTLGGELAAFQFTGINKRATVLAEGRFDLQLRMPLPERVGRVGGELLLVADVAGGANHLLAPWIRAGGGLRGTFAAWGANR